MDGRFFAASTGDRSAAVAERAPSSAVTVIPSGETAQDMRGSARFIAGLPVQGVKIHLLHVLRGTPLAAAYAAGGFETMAREDYVSVVCDQLELLPPGMVIGRLTGDGPAGDLIAPLWSRRKREALNAIDQELARRDSWQGKFCRKIP